MKRLNLTLILLLVSLASVADEINLVTCTNVEDGEIITIPQYNEGTVYYSHSGLEVYVGEQDDIIINNDKKFLIEHSEWTRSIRLPGGDGGNWVGKTINRIEIDLSSGVGTIEMNQFSGFGNPGEDYLLYLKDCVKALSFD